METFFRENTRVYFQKSDFVQIIFLLFTLGFPSFGFSLDDFISFSTISQKREKDETYDQALKRYLNWQEWRGTLIQPFAKTALGEAVPLASLNISSAPKWDNLGSDFKVVQEGFEQVRDRRYLKMPEGISFLRRPSWLYPDDGCFARAALTSQKLESLNYPRPYKLFVFGNLSVSTPNHPDGWVYWWYHEVPAISWGAALFVFDPAIDPTRPLLWTEWIAQMTSNAETLKASLCNSYAYEPDSLCEDATPSAENNALNHQIYYLKLEWQRLLNLGRDTKRELGDDPPWLNLTLD